MSSTAADTKGQIPVTKGTLRRAIAAAALGNAMEWYDFGVFAYLAVYIGSAFFPADDPTSELLAAFATFAVAFAVRPLGGLFFGPLGDKIGRQRVLAMTIILMAFGTFVIGVLPTWHQVGFWAPVLLVLARLIQGFSTGGEYGGAATFMAEYAPDDKRGFLCSWLEFGTLGGYVVALGIVTLLTDLLPAGGMHAWGWRIPFLCAAPLGLIGLYLRLKLEDTPAFQHLLAESDARRPPLKELLGEVFREHWRQMLKCVGVVILLNVAYYSFFADLPNYLKTTLGIGGQQARIVFIAVLIGMMIVLTPIGRLSDRIGRKPILLASATGFIVLSVPIYLLMGAGGMAELVIGIALLALLVVMLSATMPATLPAMFTTRTRYGGFAVAYNVSTSAFGGTAPYAITALIAATGLALIPAYYLIAAAVVAYLPLVFLHETAGKRLHGSHTSTVLVDQDADNA